MSTLDNTVDDTSWAGTGVIMPFGKHAGKPLSEVPPQYLRWAYYDCNFTLYPELQRNRAAARAAGRPQHQDRGRPVRQVPERRYARPRAPLGTREPRRRISRGRTPTGLEAFRQAFDRARHESLAEFRDEPEIRDLLEETLGKVRKALGI